MEDVKLDQTNTTTAEITLTEVQQKALKEAQEKLDAFSAELETKKYFVDLSDEDIKILMGFITEDAKWKFMEALGIGEVKKELEKSVDKNGKVFIPAVAIEAIYYYLSKVEGVGSTVDSKSIGTVDKYLKLLKGINTARGSVGIDNEKKKQLEYNLACAAEGLDPENPEVKD